MNQETPDKPIYAAFFAESAFQEWIDKTAGNFLHEIIGKGAENAIMDAAHGLGHRLKTGHDLSGFKEVLQKEGIGSATEWFQHMFSDLMSPDGIPLPGVSYVYRFLEDTFGLNVSEKFFIDWGCVNAADIVSGGLALLILARVHKLATEEKRIKRLASLTIGQILLIAVAEANPFFIATISIQALLMRHEWQKWQLKRLEKRLQLSRQISEGANELLERIKRTPLTE